MLVSSSWIMSLGQIWKFLYRSLQWALINMKGADKSLAL
jgi:hypothetical protein